MSGISNVQAKEGTEESKIKKISVATNVNAVSELSEIFGIKALNALLNKQNKIKRWGVEGDEIYSETNSQHLIQVSILITFFELKFCKSSDDDSEYLTNYVKIEDLYIKLFTYNIGEIIGGDKTIHDKRNLDKSELKKLKVEENNNSINIIKNLEKYNINENEINKVIKSFNDYHKNKNIPGKYTDNFLKFIIRFQALTYINRYIDDFEKIEANYNKNILNELVEINKPFQELGIDLLIDFAHLLNQNSISKEDINKVTKLYPIVIPEKLY